MMSYSVSSIYRLTGCLWALDGGHLARKERSVTVEIRGDDFLETMKTGDSVKGHTDGTVEVGSHNRKPAL